MKHYKNYSKQELQDLVNTHGSFKETAKIHNWVYGALVKYCSRYKIKTPKIRSCSQIPLKEVKQAYRKGQSTEAAAKILKVSASNLLDRLSKDKISVYDLVPSLSLKRGREAENLVLSFCRNFVIENSNKIRLNNPGYDYIDSRLGRVDIKSITLKYHHQPLIPKALGRFIYSGSKKKNSCDYIIYIFYDENRKNCFGFTLVKHFTDSGTSFTLYSRRNR